MDDAALIARLEERGVDPEDIALVRDALRARGRPRHEEDYETNVRAILFYKNGRARGAEKDGLIEAMEDLFSLPAGRARNLADGKGYTSAHAEARRRFATQFIPTE
ncbi:hypothetical protein [Bradyrhizobium sp. MOS003]|uniref:hypothetical protein n=1 Tax=Bradyrhizobium sp. MOS003 TaxID=2133946 RepID=UPI000D12C0FD|nr:hypothetical protein [Bradyrhizobium sp. MOS003]PSO19143.1 hypothetical protein C7G42_12640 [Bradyrhizobium sp. MOS003]